MRKYYIDYLRVVLMIGVIILHVSANNWYGYVETNRWIVFTIYSAICRVAVPCFFMISGALFLDDSKKLEYMKFAKKPYYQNDNCVVCMGYVLSSICIGWKYQCIYN